MPKETDSCHSGGRSRPNKVQRSNFFFVLFQGVPATLKKKTFSSFPQGPGTLEKKNDANCSHAAIWNQCSLLIRRAEKRRSLSFLAEHKKIDSSIALPGISPLKEEGKWGKKGRKAINRQFRTFFPRLKLPEREESPAPITTFSLCRYFCCRCRPSVTCAWLG